MMMKYIICKKVFYHYYLSIIKKKLKRTSKLAINIAFSIGEGLLILNMSAP